MFGKKYSYKETVEKVFYNQMLVTFRDVQTKALDDLSSYVIEMNTIHQRELHQNFDFVNFANNKLFTKEKERDDIDIYESEMYDDKLSLSSLN